MNQIDDWALFLVEYCFVLFCDLIQQAGHSSRSRGSSFQRTWIAAFPWNIRCLLFPIQQSSERDEWYNNLYLDWTFFQLTFAGGCLKTSSFADSTLIGQETQLGYEQKQERTGQDRISALFLCDQHVCFVLLYFSLSRRFISIIFPQFKVGRAI